MANGSDSTARPSRPRSAGVRAAILDAARVLFTEHGYDAAGIRDIASAAAVNPAIVIRHFGSKERLFVEAVDAAAGWRALLDGPLDHLGERVVGAIIRNRDNGLRVYSVLVRASGRPEVRDHLRRAIYDLFAEPIAERLDVADGPLRAHLFAAQLVGLITALSVYDDHVVIEAAPHDLVSRYGRSLQELLTGP